MTVQRLLKIINVYKRLLQLHDDDDAELQQQRIAWDRTNEWFDDLTNAAHFRL